MTGILAIETATDACSVASLGGQIRERPNCAAPPQPAAISPCWKNCCPVAIWLEMGIQVIAYGSGPGSFTGLRIAASAVQGHGVSAVAYPQLLFRHWRVGAKRLAPGQGRSGQMTVYMCTSMPA